MVKLLIAVLAILALAPGRAAAFDEIPPPEDLAPLPLRHPTNTQLATGPLLLLPGNDRLAMSSLGWRVAGARWLGPRLALAVTVDYIELAKAAGMASDLGLKLCRADLGLRLRSGTAPNLQFLADLAVGYGLVSRSWHTQRHRHARAHARLAIGATGELSPYLYFASSVDYSSAGHVTMALTVARAF